MDILFQFNQSTFASMIGLALFTYLVVEFGVKPLLAAWGIEKGKDKRYPVFTFLSALLVGILASFGGMVMMQVSIEGMAEPVFALSRGIVGGVLAIAGHEGVSVGQKFIGGEDDE